MLIICSKSPQYKSKMQKCIDDHNIKTQSQLQHNNIVTINIQVSTTSEHNYHFPWFEWRSEMSTYIHCSLQRDIGNGNQKVVTKTETGGVSTD